MHILHLKLKNNVINCVNFFYFVDYLNINYVIYCIGIKLILIINI